MILREMFAKFGLDFDAASFARANGAVERLKGAAVKLAAIVGAGWVAREIKQAVTETIDLADATQKSATKLGIASSAYQELRFAADLANISASDFERGLTLFTKKVGDAATGNQEAADSFAQIGVSIRGADGKIRTADDLIGSVADKMKGASSATERLRIAMDLFGAKGGARFVELMKDGAAGIALAREEARALGGVFSEDFQTQADAFNDNMTRVKFAIQGAKIELVNALLPALVEVTSGIVAWVKANRGLIKERIDRFIHVVASGARLLWGVLRAVHAAFVALVSVFGGTRNALIALGVAFGVQLVAQIGAAVAATGAFTAAQMVARLVALGNALLIGAAFIALGAIIVLVGQEIAANFTDAEGLFERMRGKWILLSDMMRADIGGDDNPLLSFVRLLLSEVARLIGWIDAIDDALFKVASTVADFFTNFGVNVDAFYARIGRLARDNPMIAGLLGKDLINSTVATLQGRGSVTATPAVAAAVSQRTASASTAINVNVDASGQVLDEAAMNDIITRGVDASLARANAQALQSLTPSLANP